MDRLERIRAMLDAQDWAGAAAVLEQTDVQRLDWAGQDRAAKALAALPGETVRSSPLLNVRAAQLAAARGDNEALRRALLALGALRERSREDTPGRRRVENLLSAASLLKEGTDNAQLLLTLSVMYNELQGQQPQAVFSATGGRPSVLDGAQDLSQWGRNWKAVSSIVRPMLGALLPHGGRGAAEAACAELLYLKNDLNGAALQVSAAKSAPDPEIRFAGQALTARLHLLDGAARPPEELVEGMLRSIDEAGAGWLQAGARAFAARLDVARGRVQQAAAWAAGYEGDAFARCTPRGAYVLQTKAQVYLAAGRCREAAMLTEDLLLACPAGYTIRRVEYLLDGALACRRLGNEDAALDKVCAALALAQPYGYVRLFADRAAPMQALLALAGRARTLPDEQAAFLKKAAEAAANMALLCPALYAPPAAEAAPPELTAAEAAVLQLLDQGKTNKEICEAMGIKLPTAKFHIHNLCEKLGAANRTAALAQAKKRGLL